MLGFLQELKRRNVYKVAIVYSGVAWLLLEFAATVAEPLGLPLWTINFILLLAVIGFPLSLIVSWMFELTPEGLKRQAELDQGGQGAQAVSPFHVIEFVVFLGLSLLVGYLYLERLSLQQELALQPALASSGEAQAVGDTATPASPPHVSPSPSAQADPHSIAVLPFVDMSAAGDQEWFGDGMAEELLNALVKIPELKVVARTSSFAFKGQNKSIQEIARTLGVATVLEGSVRKSGKRLRITAQLINAADNLHLWSQTYDRELDDIFAIQDEITRNIASSLKVKLGLNQPVVVPKTNNIQAYQYYLQGVSELPFVMTPEQSQRVKLSFQKAIALDSQFAEAYSSLAFLYMYEATNLSLKSYGEYVADIENTLQQALEIEPDNLTALLVQASHRLVWYRDWSYYEKLRVNYRDYHGNWFTTLLLSDPDFFEGNDIQLFTVFRKFQQRDPLNSFSYVRMGQMALSQGKFALADEVIQQGLILNPDNPHLLEVYFYLLIHEGRAKKAQELLTRIERSTSQEHPWTKLNHSRLRALLGDKEGAQKIVDSLLTQYSENGGVLVWIADITCFLGDREACLALLEKAVYDKKNYWSNYARLDFSYYELESEPRFQAILKHLGLDDASINQRRLKREQLLATQL